MKFPVLAPVACLCLGSLAPCVRAQTAPLAADAPVATVAVPSNEHSGAVWRLMYSPATYHYSRDPNHQYVWMVGLERERPDGVVAGLTYFSNSFGQPSTYAYAGQRLTNFSDCDKFFLQWTGGVIYGYKPPFDDKVPLNVRGFSPGLVLTLGWQFTRAWSTQVNVLGNSALMFQLSTVLP